MDRLDALPPTAPPPRHITPIQWPCASPSHYLPSPSTPARAKTRTFRHTCAERRCVAKKRNGCESPEMGPRNLVELVALRRARRTPAIARTRKVDCKDDSLARRRLQTHRQRTPLERERPHQAVVERRRGSRLPTERWWDHPLQRVCDANTEGLRPWQAVAQDETLWHDIEHIFLCTYTWRQRCDEPLRGPTPWLEHACSAQQCTVTSMQWFRRFSALLMQVLHTDSETAQ